MIARHPLTGKEVRVIQTDASTWKEHKTLSFTQTSHFYDTVYTSSPSTFLLQISPISPEDLAAASKTSLVVFLSKQAAAYKTPTSLKNIAILEELHTLYPHIGAPWDGTVEDAAVLVAGLIGYRRLYGVWNDRAPTLGLEKAHEPFRLWWVTQYYTPTGPKSQRREKELRQCLERNLASNLIDRVVLLNEKKENLPSLPSPQPNRLEERIIGKRLSYADVIEAASTFPLDVVVAFANADICIDDPSWRSLWSVNLENKFLALLRYDVPESGDTTKATIFGPRADSQDTWVIRVADIRDRSAATIAKTLHFNFGRMGCDNAIALEMLKHRFTVINPCLSMKTWHFHASDVRTYNKQDIVDRPILHYVHPSGFHDLQPILQLSPIAQITPSSLSRQIRGGGATHWISQHNRTIQTGQTPLKLSHDNPLTPSKELILAASNCFQTPGGLAFDRSRMFIGPSQTAQRLWSDSATSSLTPTLACEKALVVPWPAGADDSREIYVLKYLSKVLQLLPPASQGWEFFCPEKKEVVEALETFEWAADKLPVLRHEEDMLVWCKEAIIMAPSDNACFLAEDVAALRKALKAWKDTPTIVNRPRIVIVEDGEVLHDGLVRSLEDVLEKAFDVRVVYSVRTSAHRMADVFTGAWGVICKGSLEACGWNWMLPVGAFVFEVASAAASASTYVDALNLSAAAGLEHRFCKPGGAAENIFEEVWKEEEAFRSQASPAGSEEALPLILVPRKDIDGYFAHAGDSFREMVRLWEKAGYCRVKEHSLATMVWWGSVGKDGVLLYDRDNHDWRHAAPLVERDWRLALFGNPKPPSDIRAKPWTYWPRRPELVEEASSLSQTPRKPGLIFMGRMENKVQEKRRTTASWSSACTEWHMVQGLATYPFTQSEYLQKLSQYRFGLCLPGYGFKCHREIECMAMGCVPVCSEGVDMDSYASPPAEGVHYIRVKTPEEAAAAASMSDADWQKMSEACRAWWKENCSCEGSFQLTKKLVLQG
jgi:hypothetical protein